MKSKDCKDIIEVVVESDLADGKVRELAFKFLGNDKYPIDELKDGLMDLVQLDRDKCIKHNQKLLTKSMKNVQ
jgi:hypothetical protein